MSLGQVISYNNQRRMSEGQFVGDLAGLFERRHIAMGAPHVCEQFEILLTTSDSFRSQLFTLCTAISHMSEQDLSGEELLELIARALGAETEDAASLPAAMRRNFLSGLEAWNNRNLQAHDEWPHIKKPVLSVDEAPAPANDSTATQPKAAARPTGVHTLQKALEIARIRGGDIPLRPEPELDTAPTWASASVPESPEINSATIEELNALLVEIEERMKRLRPQLGAAEAAQPVAQPNPALAQPALPVALSAAPAEPPPRPALSADWSEPTPTPELFAEERDDAFLERHPYLRPDRLKHVLDIMAARAMAFEADDGEFDQTAPMPVTIKAEPELQLVPRHIIEDEKTGVDHDQPEPPTLVIPDMVRFKTYLALAVLAGIVLVGTPISAVIAYRYLHPVYIYDQDPQHPVEAAPAAAQPAPKKGAGRGKSLGGANSGTQPRFARPGRKDQAQRNKEPAEVWPAPRPGDVEVWPARRQ
jgi:hypothetical protein